MSANYQFDPAKPLDPDTNWSLPHCMALSVYGYTIGNPDPAAEAIGAKAYEAAMRKNHGADWRREELAKVAGRFHIPVADLAAYVERFRPVAAEGIV